MRDFIEPSMRNLLRRPLVLGVPVQGLLALSVGVVSLSILFGSEAWGNAVTAGLGLGGYLALRLAQRFLVTGWEESLLFPLEITLSRTKKSPITARGVPNDFTTLEVFAPETATPSDLIAHKEALIERFSSLPHQARLLFRGKMSHAGLQLTEISLDSNSHLGAIAQKLKFAAASVQGEKHLYTLKKLPVFTDPTWLDGLISKLNGDFTVWVSVRGLEPNQTRKRLEHIRRSTSQSSKFLSDIDADVTFQETSRVLMGLSRGDEAVVEASLLIASVTPQALDPDLWCHEKKRALPMLSILGLRPRFHRSHWMRAVTASDLVPSVGDPDLGGCTFLKSQRGKPLFFDPQDGRLESLHWLVSGASGSGKSFFTGVVLHRLIQSGAPLSVIFIDHNRSFRRLVRSQNPNYYFEPQHLHELQEQSAQLLQSCNPVGTVVGIELSDLPLSDKKEAARILLSEIEHYLRTRNTSHPLYVVLDECWNFLRDDSLLIQRAFREFRKLNGAVIAITQSLHDFLQDPTGQSIFQNAPVRIILRQGEDLEKHRGVLGLNDIELERARRLKQSRGEFSECLIKTPFLSRIGRLYPSSQEHTLLRTDNLREEWISEHLNQRTNKSRTVLGGAAPCEAGSSLWD